MGDLGVDELPHHPQKVIQGEQEGLAQFHPQKFLRRSKSA